MDTDDEDDLGYVIENFDVFSEVFTQIPMTFANIQDDEAGRKRFFYITTNSGMIESVEEVGEHHLPSTSCPAPEKEMKERTCSCDLDLILRSGCQCGGV